MGQFKTIILVCTGNTCRSPMAEAMLKQALEEVIGDQAKDIKVGSAGVAAFHGDPASHYAKTVMEKRGLDISNHRAQHVSPGLLSDADLVLTMTTMQKEELQRKYPAFKSKFNTLIEFAGLEQELGVDIGDPFGCSPKAYQSSADQISKAVKAAAGKIKDLLKSRGDNSENRHRE
ncbi:MAG: low molecular weight protein arginine phosphatase [Firmicutes bacterium]|nr:low molecular weight protein arginine phosphatase [Bacillota bacterium]